MTSLSGITAATIAVVHNHPIHYKQLLFNAMVDHGLRLTVLYVSSNSGIRHTRQRLAGSKYDFRIGTEKAYEKANPLRTACFVWRELNRLRPSIVIFGGYCDVAVWCAWTWAQIYRRPGVLWAETNQNDRPRLIWKEMLKRLFLKSVRERMCMAPDAARTFAIWAMTSDRILLKRAVVNTARFTIEGPVLKGEHPELRLLYVGRLSPEKNLPFLFHAVKRAATAAWGARLRLQIVGYGPQEEELRRLANALGLTNRLEFLGPREQDDLPEVYRQADVFVLPSLREPYGLVVLEALSMGTPVALSSRCGCAHDLEAPQIGWHFDPEEDASIDSVLRSAAGLTKDELNAIGERARGISSQFSPDSCAKRIKAGLLHLAGDRTGSALPPA